jgi:hypothetical protein
MVWQKYWQNSNQQGFAIKKPCCSYRQQTRRMPTFVYLCKERFKSQYLKKLFSSVFVVLILLNVMGYYGLFLGLQYKNARDMISQFDAGTYELDEAELIKIPFPSPDGYSSEVFERVDGDFEHNGKVYRLIKQRLYRDTFHIVYIKDKVGTALNNALADYVKTFSDESSDPGQAKILPLFIKEYFIRHFSLQHLSPGYALAVRQESQPRVLIDVFETSIVHPPERA